MRVKENEIGNINRNLNLQEKKCLHCGRIFFTNYEKSKYCSDSCRILSWRRKHRYNDSNGESSSELFDDDNPDDNNLNLNTMSSNELITQIQKNADLNLESKLLQKDYGILKSENERLKSEIESLKSDFSELDSELERLQQEKDDADESESMDLKATKDALRSSEEEVQTLNESLESLESENKRLRLAVVIYRNISRNTVPTLKAVQQVYPEVSLDKPDRFQVDDYKLTRPGGSETYVLSKI